MEEALGIKIEKDEPNTFIQNYDSTIIIKEEKLDVKPDLNQDYLEKFLKTEVTIDKVENVDVHQELYETSKEPLKCQVCNEKFYDNNALTDHFQEHTSHLMDDKPKDKVPLKCQVCYEIFYDASTLTEHFKTHMGQHAFECKRCDKSFPLKDALDDHLRMSHNSNVYDCIYCNKSFTSKHTLANHTRRHTAEEKKLQCEFCNKHFLNKRLLKIHFRTHKDVCYNRKRTFYENDDSKHVANDCECDVCKIDKD